jgi:hypothetical protein
MQTNTTRPSAANIVIRRRPAPTNFIERLRQLVREAGPSKHDQAIALISACILQGLNARAQIIDLGMTLGFNRKHIAIQLIEHTGNSPERHRWSVDTNGKYALLPD